MTREEFSALVIFYGTACHELGAAIGLGDMEHVPDLLRIREQGFEKLLLLAGLQFPEAIRAAS